MQGFLYTRTALKAQRQDKVYRLAAQTFIEALIFFQLSMGLKNYLGCDYYFLIVSSFKLFLKNNNHVKLPVCKRL